MVTPSSAPDYLVAGNPSMPIPVLPEKMRMRNAIMIGAMAGIALAWVILNFKWLRRKFTMAEEEEEIEEGDDRS